MAEIKFISKTMVQPAKIHGEPIDRIELTPWDLQFLLVGAIQKGIVFQKPTPLQDQLFGNSLVDHLETTFAFMLEYFYPLAGRFGIIENEDDDTSSFFIDCNNKGAYFVHTAVTSVTVKDVTNPLRTPNMVHSFFPMNGKFNLEGDTNPFLAVQVNELVDGFFIGCTMNHAAVDGSSFWHFLNSWSEISRGLKKISKLPSFKRWFPSETITPLRIPTSMCSYKSIKSESPPLEERVFHFPKDKISNLKLKANAEMNTTSISSLQALLAHLWLSVIRSQNIDSDEEVEYKLIIGARQRLHTFIPDCYFGSAVSLAEVTTTVGELLKLGLGEVASRMHQVIALQTSDEVVNKFKIWAENPTLSSSGAFCRSSLITISSPRFNVYGTDFGCGKPLAVQSGSANKPDGKLTLFPGAEEGSIDIEVCLSPEKLSALENHKEFIEAVAL